MAFSLNLVNHWTNSVDRFFAKPHRIWMADQCGRPEPKITEIKIRVYYMYHLAYAQHLWSNLLDLLYEITCPLYQEYYYI